MGHVVILINLRLVNVTSPSPLRLTERHMARIAHGAVSALKYLHALGVVHRDVKSDSILLSLTGQVKINPGKGIFSYIFIMLIVYFRPCSENEPNDN